MIKNFNLSVKTETKSRKDDSYEFSQDNSNTHLSMQEE